MHRVVQQAFFGDLLVGDVGERADHAQDLAVGADHRTGAQVEPAVMAVLGAQPQFLDDAAAAVLEHAVERHAEAVAVGLMQMIEPAGGRGLQRAALEAEQLVDLRAHVDEIAVHVPIPDHVAGAGDGERAALEVGDDALGAGRRRRRAASP